MCTQKATSPSRARCSVLLAAVLVLTLVGSASAAPFEWCQDMFQSVGCWGAPGHNSCPWSPCLYVGGPVSANEVLDFSGAIFASTVTLVSDFQPLSVGGNSAGHSWVHGDDVQQRASCATWTEVSLWFQISDPTPFVLEAEMHTESDGWADRVPDDGVICLRGPADTYLAYEEFDTVFDGGHQEADLSLSLQGVLTPPGCWQLYLYVSDTADASASYGPYSASGSHDLSLYFAIPEPATITLLALGGLTLIRYRRK